MKFDLQMVTKNTMYQAVKVSFKKGDHKKRPADFTLLSCLKR